MKTINKDELNAILRKIQENPFKDPIERYKEERNIFKNIERIDDGLFNVPIPD